MELGRGKRKVCKGIVVSDKMVKTITVMVERKFPHPVYRKIIRTKTKFKVHDPQDSAGMGDIVEIMETRPLSKDKRWRLVKIIKKASSIKSEGKDIKDSVEQSTSSQSVP